MSETAFYETFLKETASRINDVELHGHIDHARRNYKKSFGEAITQFTELESARRRAAHIRWKSINDLEKYLIQFESTFIKSGGKVVWARDAAEACAEINAIIQKAQAKVVVKSKSLTADEIGLGQALQTAGVSWTETDLGQFILQLAQEEPSHMVMPALHKSPEEVRYLFNKVGIQTNSAQAIELSLRAADHIREKYLTPDVGITGANFLLADEGAAVICTNEGNFDLSVGGPPVHIVFVGIEKLIRVQLAVAGSPPREATAALARFIDHPNYIHVQADLADRAAVEQVFAHHKPERVINLAAHHSGFSRRVSR